MSEYKHQVNVKLGDATYESLNNIAEFEDIKPSELIRDWIREKIVQYRQKDRLYLRFLEKKEKREKQIQKKGFANSE